MNAILIGLISRKPSPLNRVELLRELCLLPELLDDDRDDDDLLRLFLDAKTGSVNITAPSITMSANLRFNLDSFMIKSRISPVFKLKLSSKQSIIILAKQLQFVK